MLKTCKKDSIKGFLKTLFYRHQGTSLFRIFSTKEVEKAMFSLN